jgi:hypothetical protein
VVIARSDKQFAIVAEGGEAYRPIMEKEMRQFGAVP